MSVARLRWQARVESGLGPVAIGFDVVVLEGDRIRGGLLDRAPGAV